jgi:DNA-binding transcriptional ArsR family regulator
MGKSQFEAAYDDTLPLLSDDVPVVMPDLPIRLTISSEQQFKAISDMVRSRILGVIQYQPLTARQIAQRLQATSGAIGHHLRVLEEAGMVKIVARRITRGIVASYYTRTARIFDYDLPPEVRGSAARLDIAEKAHAELLDSTVSYDDDPLRCDAFPHVRLSLERITAYQKRFIALMDELIEETPDPNGEVYGVFFGIFKSPPYMQVSKKNGDGSPADEEEKL